MSIEYAGIFVNYVDSGAIVKLCDTQSVHKTALLISESEIKKTIKPLIKQLQNDECQHKTLSMTHQYYIYQY